MSNFITKAKIEIEGLVTNKIALFVQDSSSFVVGEVIIGQNSGASAVCERFIDVGFYDIIILKDRDGFFDKIEPIIGSIAGSTETISGQGYFEDTYTNSDLGISDGLWTIETSGDLLSSIDDSVRKIDISKGGNYATGYTFGFTLANLTLVKTLVEDGVFLQNLPVKYFIDFGAGYTQIWTGILDTFPKTGAVEAKFTCIDSMKAKSEKIGSEKVPICLNENFNCKLPLADDGEGETVYTVPNQGNTGVVNYSFCYGPNKSFNVDTITDVDEGLQTVLFLVNNSSEWKTALDSGDQLSLRASAGANSGTTYNITAIQNQGSNVSGYTYYSLVLDQAVSDIVGTITGTTDLTLFKLIKFQNTYNLSQNDVLNVHESNSSTERTLRSIDDRGVETFMTKGVNFDNTQKQVYVFGIGEDGDIVAKDSRSIDYSSTTFTEDITDGSTFTTVIANVDVSLQDLVQFSDINDDVYLSLKTIIFHTNFDSGTGYVDPNLGCTVSSKGVYRSDIVAGGVYGSTFLSQSLTIYGAKNGSDIEITPVIPNEFLKFNGFGDGEVYSTSFIRFTVIFSVQNSSYSGTPIITGVDFEDFVYQTISPIDIGELAIGSNGENLTSGRYVGYPETLKYIQTNYAGFDISEINEASYTQAENDYELFPSSTGRNPAHQIIQQTSYNDILKDLLYFSHLGLFPDRLGKLTLSNWLPKSTVFSDTAVESSYSETEYSNISDIKRPTTVKVISDFELQYDYSEAEDEYKSFIRIKDTDATSFLLTGVTEGVTSNFEKEAEQAWELLRAGFNRVKRLTQFKVESKWIKRFFSRNSFEFGESEAINFIRNQAGHSNREHERVTITLQLNETDAIKELLSFDSVYHLKKTENEIRKGWLVESRISWRSKTIKFTYLLDISLKDPFLYRIGIIQDNSTVDDIIVNDNTSNDIIEDGGGI